MNCEKEVAERLLVFHQSRDFAGTDVFLLTIMKVLAERKWEIFVVTVKGNSVFEKKAANYATILHYRYRWMQSVEGFGVIDNVGKLAQRFAFPLWVLLNILNCCDLIKSKRVKRILLVNSGVPGGMFVYTALAACGISGANTVSTYHNFVSYPRGYKWILRWFEGKVGKLKNVHYVAVSNYCAKDIAENSYAIRNLHTIHNGIEPGRLSEISRERKVRSNESFEIVFVGNFHRRKGIHVLLESYKMLNCKAHLTLFGKHVDKKYSDEMHKIADGASITIRTDVFDTEKMYADKHVLVLPSIQEESFGLVIIEAMSYGVPVIGTNDFGVKEVICIDEMKPFGKTFRKGDSLDLAQKIDHLAGNINLWKRYSENCRIVFNERFTAEKMVAQYMELLG